jgi:YebC/PmpR family DNA-binding regulatory protein
MIYQVQFLHRFIICGILETAMSGHSHYATIKRQKETKDAARGNLFSKLARIISIAVKTGGGPNPEANFKLKIAIDKARAANMPKDNIDRAIARASGGEALEEITYEGFGPSGIGVIVEVATDNRNRTSQEMKNSFERAGGSLAGPGAVSYNFESKGFLLVKKQQDSQGQMLALIDLGVEDIEESEDGLEVYVPVDKLSETKKKLEENGFEIASVELEMKPKSLQKLDDANAAKKVLAFLESLEELEDVQRVSANIDIPQEILSQIKD